MRIILLGPPGCGKGTQGELIERKYGFPKISAGDILRQAVKEGNFLGKKAETFMNQGKLVSDDIVIKMIEERIKKADCRIGYVLDGFPRNIIQAKALDKFGDSSPEIVIDIQMDERALVNRLTARRVCSRCGAIYNLLVRKPRQKEICDVCGGPLVRRQDDDPEVIKERLGVYHLQTEKLIGYYLRKKVYDKVNGQGEINTVFRRICALLDRKVAKFGESEARG